MMQPDTDTSQPVFAPLMAPAPQGLSPLERLAVLLSLARFTPDEQAELDRLAGDPALDWAALYAVLDHNAIKPLAQKHLVRAGHWSRVPAAIAEPWDAFTRLIAERNDRRIAIARPLFTEAAEAGIRIALLKGIYFAPTYYGDLGYKKMNDIDFLMPVEDLDRLLALYKKHGFFSLGLIKDDDEKQTSFSHHAPPFFHPSLDCVLGTHWGLVSPLTKFKPDYAAMWQRAVPFEFAGASHWALHAVDNAHHLCIHMPYYKTGLRELADLYNLIRQESAGPGGFDWTLFGAEVAKAGTEPLVFHALSLCQALVPMPEVAAYLAKLAPSARGFYARDTRHRIREPRRILYARSTHMSDIDKCYGEFSLTDDFPTKLKAFVGMWGRGLVAPTREIARFHYLDEDAATLRLLYPSMFARVLRYIAKDLGWPIFGLLVLKMNVDLGKSAWRTLTGRQKQNKLAAAAERNGLTPAQIEQIKGLLE